MDNVTIERQRLIVEIRKNREKHKAEYNDSCVEYKVAALNLIDQKFKEFNEGTLSKISKGEMIHIPPIYFDIDPPTSHVKQYDEVLQMLEMSSEDKVTISRRDFVRYVLDEWEWKEEENRKRLFYASNSGVGQ